jgi:hypothetical protein
VTVTDYPDWQTPQAHATSIANTGVPLLRASNQLASGAATTIAGGGTAVLLPATALNQPGYEMSFEVSMPLNTGTLPFIDIQMLWSDSVTGVRGARRDVVVTAGNGPGSVVVSYANGQCRGDTLTVNAINLDPAVTATLKWVINQTSHVYEHDQAGQRFYPGTAPHGYSNPAGVPGTGVIAWQQPTLGAGVTQAVLCALYGGDIFVAVDTLGIASAVIVSMTDAAGLATGSTGGEFFADSIPSGSAFTVAMTLPFTPVLLSLSNPATVGLIAPKVTLIAQNH